MYNIQYEINISLHNHCVFILNKYNEFLFSHNIFNLKHLILNEQILIQSHKILGQFVDFRSKKCTETPFNFILIFLLFYFSIQNRQVI